MTKKKKKKKKERNHHRHDFIARRWQKETHQPAVQGRGSRAALHAFAF